MRFDFLIPVLYNAADVAWYDGVGRELKALGQTVAFIALSRATYDGLRAHHDHVYYLYEDGPPPTKVGLDEIMAVEQKYGLESMSDFVRPEMHYWGRPYEELAARAVFTFRWLERWLSQNEAAFSLNNCGAELIRRALRTLGSFGGPQNILIDFAPFHGRLCLTVYEGKWDDVPEVPPPLTNEQREVAMRLVREATTSKKMFATPARLINPGVVGRYLKHFRTVLSGEHLDYSNTFSFKERLRSIGRRPFGRFLYEMPVPGEDYLFFPLHVPGDSALTVMSPQFSRQEFLVEYLALRALPAGTKLYVKPHPAGRDSYPLPVLRRIAALPNVRLIEPTVNSHQMIQGSRGVVVINSTTGFEAVLYEKPVLALGRGWYLGHGVTHDLTNLVNLRHELHHALANPPEHEAVLRFVHAAWAATFPGRYYDTSDENLRSIATNLLDKSRRLAAAAS